jgi:hypothetical protein
MGRLEILISLGGSSFIPACAQPTLKNDVMFWVVLHLVINTWVVKSGGHLEQVIEQSNC